MLDWLSRPEIASKAILLVFCLLCAVLLIEVTATVSGAYPHWVLLVEALPVPFFLAAIWSIRRAVLLIGTGVALRSLASGLLERVGIALLLGGLAMVFAVPTLVRLLTAKGSFLHYDVSAITLGVIGVGLMILSRLIAEAQAIRRELDEFL